ncbi:MAG: hypothetical protein ABI352_02640 [Candidatus Dormibacter sp.]
MPNPRAAAEELLRRQSRHRPNNASGVIDMETVRFAVERYAVGRCLLGATMRDRTGGERYLIAFAVAVADSPANWRLTNARLGMLDGSDGGPWDGSLKLLYEIDEQVVNAFECVGFVLGREAQRVATVALTFGDGRRYEESIEDGWVAFAIEGEPQAPVTFELLDGAASMIWRGTSSAMRIWRHNR